MRELDTINAYNFRNVDEFLKKLSNPTDNNDKKSSNAELFKYLSDVSNWQGLFDREEETYLMNIFNKAGGKAEKATKLFYGLENIRCNDDKVTYPEHKLWENVIELVK